MKTPFDYIAKNGLTATLLEKFRSFLKDKKNKDDWIASRYSALSNRDKNYVIFKAKELFVKEHILGGICERCGYSGDFGLEVAHVAHEVRKEIDGYSIDEISYKERKGSTMHDWARGNADGCSKEFAYKEFSQENCALLCSCCHIIIDYRGKHSSIPEKRHLLELYNEINGRDRDFKFRCESCHVCEDSPEINGCISVFSFHHVDPSAKRFELSDKVISVKNGVVTPKMGLTMDDIKRELSGCIILCSNCHKFRENHSNQSLYNKLRIIIRWRMQRLIEEPSRSIKNHKYKDKKMKRHSKSKPIKKEMRLFEVEVEDTEYVRDNPFSDDLDYRSREMKSLSGKE